VRALALHPSKYLFASASADNIKQWKCPEGTFMKNVAEGGRAIVNCLAVNHDDVFVAVMTN
jgi:pleiotropic regulator 1